MDGLKPEGPGGTREGTAGGENAYVVRGDGGGVRTHGGCCMFGGTSKGGAGDNITMQGGGGNMNTHGGGSALGVGVSGVPG